VAGGSNACVLHYVQNDSVLKDGDLVLIDAGCELDGYASDITRTFPVSGRFSGPQRDIYQLVLFAQAAAIAQVKPGNEWEAPHHAAVKVLAQGMVDLELCKGNADSVIESGDYRRFYMHRTGHWLGMDVHDAGDYKRDGAWRKLETGMMLTVEPGCYVRPGDGVPERFWNIGVRIEDDALVTASGCEIITAAAPKSVDDIESLLRRGTTLPSCNRFESPHPPDTSFERARLRHRDCRRRTDWRRGCPRAARQRPQSSGAGSPAGGLKSGCAYIGDVLWRSPDTRTIGYLAANRTRHAH
jgi:hypothetical protein